MPYVEYVLTPRWLASMSSKLLLDAGDLDGDCNRAYYTMFEAARAALLGTGATSNRRTIGK